MAAGELDDAVTKLRLEDVIDAESALGRLDSVLASRG